jgi:DNA-binding transcriptional ArsR family regulator
MLFHGLPKSETDIVKHFFQFYRPGMTESGPRRLRDVRDLRAMAHPLRVRLYYVLSSEEAATASRLAELVQESPALVSYHLRQLGRHGFVEEAPELSTDRRERWWRLTSRGFSWSPNDFADAPEARAAAAAVKRLMLEEQFGRLRRFDEEQPAWGPDWTSAAFSTDTQLRLTAEETRLLEEELQQVLLKWAARTRGSGTDGDTRREHVQVILHGFPFRP